MHYSDQQLTSTLFWRVNRLVSTDGETRLHDSSIEFVIELEIRSTRHRHQLLD